MALVLMWSSQLDCIFLFVPDVEVSPGSFSGAHYHFCFQTYVMLPLQLPCLQWMHAASLSSNLPLEGCFLNGTSLAMTIDMATTVF